MSSAVARTGEIAPGATKRVTSGGVDVLLCNVAGTFYAIEDMCSHDGAPLDQGELEGNCIVCPRHGANFDVRTGDAMTLPAILPVPVYAVRVEGDEIFVDV